MESAAFKAMAEAAAEADHGFTISGYLAAFEVAWNSARASRDAAEAAKWAVSAATVYKMGRGSDDVMVHHRIRSHASHLATFFNAALRSAFSTLDAVDPREHDPEKTAERKKATPPAGMDALMDARGALEALKARPEIFEDREREFYTVLNGPRGARRDTTFKGAIMAANVAIPLWSAVEKAFADAAKVAWARMDAARDEVRLAAGATFGGPLRAYLAAKADKTTRPEYLDALRRAADEACLDYARGDLSTAACHHADRKIQAAVKEAALKAFSAATAAEKERRAAIFMAREAAREAAARAILNERLVDPAPKGTDLTHDLAFDAALKALAGETRIKCPKDAAYAAILGGNDSTRDVSADKDEAWRVARRVGLDAWGRVNGAADKAVKIL